MPLVGWLSRLLSRPWQPLQFPADGFRVLEKDVILEEEGLGEFTKDLYYPVKLGEVLEERFQIVGKLGFGTSSTVWLARDMQ